MSWKPLYLLHAESAWKRAKDYLATAILIGGVSYAVYAFYKVCVQCPSSLATTAVFAGNYEWLFVIFHPTEVHNASVVWTQQGAAATGRCQQECEGVADKHCRNLASDPGDAGVCEEAAGILRDLDWIRACSQGEEFVLHGNSHGISACVGLVTFLPPTPFPQGYYDYKKEQETVVVNEVKDEMKALKSLLLTRYDFVMTTYWIHF